MEPCRNFLAQNGPEKANDSRTVCRGVQPANVKPNGASQRPAEAQRPPSRLSREFLAQKGRKEDDLQRTANDWLHPRQTGPMLEVLGRFPIKLPEASTDAMCDPRVSSMKPLRA
jgi:hypothetical protein